MTNKKLLESDTGPTFSCGYSEKPYKCLMLDWVQGILAGRDSSCIFYAQRIELEGIYILFSLCPLTYSVLYELLG